MTNASRTNPTENKVFDVTLLLEQIVADFTSFKNDVRDKVYDLLKISSPWGTSYQFADWVWSVLDEYGFGAVERIINFFQTEDMQNRLANVILNDAGLQEDLNLDTPDNPDYNPEEGLDYWAVAKVGILTFADYIHDIYIADGGWKEDTWNWIFDPGYTLVDLVDAALGAIGDAVNAVKNAATSFVNGIKNYLGYFKNAVLEIMTSMYVSVLQIMIHLVSEIISQYLPQELQIVKTSNGMTINGHPISVGKENLRIFFLFDNLKITVGNPFVESNFQYETLSIAETITLALDVGLLIAIVSTLIASRAGNNFLVRGIKIGTATILSIVLASSIPYLFDSQNSDRSDYVDEFIEFTFFNTIISLSIAEALKRKTNGDNGQAPSGMSAKDYAKSARIFVGLSVVSEVLSLLLDINQLTGSTTAHVTSTAIGFVSFVGGYSWAIFSESDIDNHDLRAFNQVIGLVCGIFWVIFNIIQNMQGL